MEKKSFASDNYGGALPEMMEAVIDANMMHAKAYGYDEITREAKVQFEKSFESSLEVRFVFNGTGANVLGLSICTRSFNAVLCADTSHLYMNESTAPESFTGCRLIPLPTNSEGKLELDTIKKAITRRGDEHFPQVKVLSIAQPTECGTVYSLDELTQIGQLLKENDIIFHMDGARLFNAVAHLDCSLEDMTSGVGVDVLSVGGTKIGMLFGEAVVCFDPSLSENIKYKHKESMQLPSKTRFISSQFHRLLRDKIWERSAIHSNQMAQRLYEGVKDIASVKVTRSVQTNGVFAIIPSDWNDELIDQASFYIWNEQTNEARWMCSFDTTAQEIDDFVDLIKRLDEASQPELALEEV